jgi:hypothetical protein
MSGYWPGAKAAPKLQDARPLAWSSNPMSVYRISARQRTSDSRRIRSFGRAGVYAWLCTSATVEGLARSRASWAAGQIGESPLSSGVRKGSVCGARTFDKHDRAYRD